MVPNAKAVEEFEKGLELQSNLVLHGNLELHSKLNAGHPTRP